jgi:hypothetical protein
VARHAIPQTLAELTPEWLTGALRASGLLREARVETVDAEVLGEGEGFVGQIARLRLGLDHPEADAPRTVIAKIPTPVRQNRVGGEMLGAYEREIQFYRELAGHVAIRTPRVYYADMDESALSERGPGIVRFLESLPRLLLRILLAVFAWLVRFSRRRYLLLLEDLAPAGVGDQVAGCDLARAKQALRALARAHASLWRSPSLEGRYWLADLNAAPHMFQLGFERGRPIFDARYRDRVPARVAELIDWLDANGVELARRVASGPQTLLHGDYRLDNLFFHGAEGDVIAVDWQAASRGPGAYDVAYFLGGTLDPGVGADEELELLRAYHGELTARGVADYDFEACLRDYQRGLLLLLQRVVSGLDALDMGEERGMTLMDLWIRRLAARLEHVDPQALLA